MGIGSCENSVMVEEPLCVPIPGKRLCSEFAMQSVSEQKACSELSHPVIDCRDSVSDNASSFPSSGESLAMCSVNSDGSTGEHQDDCSLVSENLQKVDSGNVLDVCECDMGSGGEGLLEGMSEPVGSQGNLIGEGELPLEAYSVASLAGGLCVNENIGDADDCITLGIGDEIEEGGLADRDCLDVDYSGVDGCGMEVAGECMLENSLPDNDDVGNIVGVCDLALDVTCRDCLDERNSGINACGMEKAGECVHESGSHCEEHDGNRTENHVLPLEVVHVASLASGVSLSEDHGDIDAFLTGKTGESLTDITAQVRDAVGNLTRDGESPLEVTTVVSLDCGGYLTEDNKCFVACKIEKTGECLQERVLPGEDGVGDLTARCGLPMEVIPVTSLASEGCSSENQSDIEDSTVEKVGEPLKNTVPEEEGGDVDPIGAVELMLEVTPMSELSAGDCLNEYNRDQDRSKEECMALSNFHCEQVAGTAVGNFELHPKVTFVADGGCLNKNQSDTDASTTEMSAKFLAERRTHGGSHIRNPIEVCELPLEAASGDGLASGDCLDDFHNCIDGCSTERVEESLQESITHGVDDAEVLIEGRELPREVLPVAELTSGGRNCESPLSVTPMANFVGRCCLNENQAGPEHLLVNLKREDALGHYLGEDFSSREDVSKSETLSSGVLEYEHNEKNVDTRGVTESVKDENNVIIDANVQVGDPLLPPEENPCNDESACLSILPSGTTDDCSLQRSSLLDNSSLDPLKCTSSVDHFGHTDKQGKDKNVISCVSEEKSNEKVLPSSQRNGRRSRPNHKTQAKNTTRKSKKTTKGPHRCIEIAFKPTRKRSQLRSARLSVWGLLENVTQVFVHWNRLNDVIPVSNKRSWPTKLDKKNEKKSKNARAQGSKKRCPSSNTKLRLKVKIGSGVDQSVVNATFPELVDTPALSTAISCKYGAELFTKSPQVDGRKCEVPVHFNCLSNNEENTSSPGVPVPNTQSVNDSSKNLVTEKTAEDLSDKCIGVPSSILVEASETTESRCKDPGTSPDSEVINMIPDCHTDARPRDDFGCIVTSPKDPAALEGLASSKRENNQNVGNLKGKSPQAVSKSRAKPVKQYGRKQKSTYGIHSEENLDSPARENVPSDKEPSIVEPLLVSKESAVRASTSTLKGENGNRANEIHCDLDTGAGLSKSENSKKSLSAAKDPILPKGKSHPSDSRVEKFKARNKGEAAQRSVGKKKMNKSFDDQVTCLVENQPGAGNICLVENQPQAEYHVVDDNGKTNSANTFALKLVPNLDLLPHDVVPHDVGEQYITPRNAWVRCDGCLKWRRIPAQLADLIEETQCTWTCKDNMDKAFADCSTPQEKSNSDINAELEISDASGEEDAFGNRLNKGLECFHPRERQETVTCASIRTNQFLHRNRKTQTIDEIMVCHCKARSDGRLGCGDDCLNRMLNIECAQGACPCGELCSNQQFQKRKYVKLEKFPCGKKGFGLKLQEDIPGGKFLIEYVGEVLDMQAYEARQKEYALKGHKHFYFMTLNGSEVIDACTKGNKGRFINHSCEPNCRTEKWMVNGEICIGLFALRDIKKGEEVTFDYNYVRVFGAAAKKCYCLSQQCRGYIGGDPLSGDVVIQSDSDEDYPKPRRRPRDIRTGDRENVICSTRSFGEIIKQSIVQNIDEIYKVPNVVEQPETSIGGEESVNHSVSLDVQVPKKKVSPSALPSVISQQTEDVAMSTVQHERSAEEIPVKETGPYLSDNIDESKFSTKVHSKVKTSRSSSSVKKANVKNNTEDANKVQLAINKSQAVPLPSKKILEGSFGSRFEAVEEKLNELLDPDGGISRRKDAAKGYLKLLLLTSASGGTANCEGIQRNRDLSMILDALLKTRSRMVLTDIINKNGLRMLHKIMKQYRGDFKKIPILRKLLKVLEYFASREILTSEHIKEDPPRPGMESFRESILSLTEHDDRQVHYIARNFRDKWVPKHLRRPCFLDRDDIKTEYPSRTKSNRFSPTHNNGSDHSGSGRCSETTRPGHVGMPSEALRSNHGGKHSEANDYAMQPTMAIPLADSRIEDGVSASSASVPQSSGTRTRKRKSRWDQPAEIITDLSSLQHKVEHRQIEPSLIHGVGETPLAHKDKFNTYDKNCAGYIDDSSHIDKTDIAHAVQEDIVEDFPPGFSSPRKLPLDSLVAPSTIFHSKCSTDIVFGYPQEKFISRCPVSYGIPLSIMQQFGTPLEETSGSWTIAPGTPFHPFPPLPPFPRDKKQNSPSTDATHSSVNHPADEEGQDNRISAVANSNDCIPTTTTGDQPDLQIPPTNSSYSCKRSNDLSCDLGTRYFKQQKWNHTKLRPPWHWSRNGWGCVGDSKSETNSSTNSTSLGNVTNGLTSCSEDLSNQHQEHQNQH